MAYSLILILALVSHLSSSVAMAGNDSPENKPTKCRGLTQDAKNVARELFGKNRGPDSLRDYEITIEVKETEILVRFERRSSQTLGDHPFVVYDCKMREGRYFEGE